MCFALLCCALICSAFSCCVALGFLTVGLLAIFFDHDCAPLPPPPAPPFVGAFVFFTPFVAISLDFCFVFPRRAWG